MKDLHDLKIALKMAKNKQLIHEFCIETYYLDVDFDTTPHHRTTQYVEKILSLRDYIKAHYSDVRAIDFMPLLNRLRLYGNFERIK